jgi:DnaJ family protein B protein 6
MEANDDPYNLLEVSPRASSKEIKSAYRKAALKHHPDKQKTERDRKQAHTIFAKISNAYELLSDKKQRQQYDYQRERRGSDQAPPPSQTRTTPNNDFDDFASSFFTQQQRQSFPNFHDPFQVFEQVFREEFGGPSSNSNSNGARFRSPFHQDDFFSSRSMNMFDTFGGSMPNMHNSMFNNMFGGFGDMPLPSGGGDGNNSRSFTSSSTSTRSIGGESVTTTTTTKVVNGAEETVTERVVRKADGSVERFVEQGNHGNNRLLQNQSSNRKKGTKRKVVAQLERGE